MLNFLVSRDDEESGRGILYMGLNGISYGQT